MALGKSESPQVEVATADSVGRNREGKFQASDEVLSGCCGHMAEPGSPDGPHSPEPPSGDFFQPWIVWWLRLQAFCDVPFEFNFQYGSP